MHRQKINFFFFKENLPISKRNTMDRFECYANKSKTILVQQENACKLG